MPCVTEALAHSASFYSTVRSRGKMAFAGALRRSVWCRTGFVRAASLPARPRCQAPRHAKDHSSKLCSIVHMGGRAEWPAVVPRHRLDRRRCLFSPATFLIRREKRGFAPALDCRRRRTVREQSVEEKVHDWVCARFGGGSCANCAPRAAAPLFVSLRRTLELDEVVVGAVGGEHGARVLEVLALRSALSLDLRLRAAQVGRTRSLGGPRAAVVEHVAPRGGLLILIPAV